MSSSDRSNDRGAVARDTGRTAARGLLRRLAASLGLLADRQTTNRITGARRNVALVAVLLTMFFASLDQTVVATAMPSIITDLRGFDVYAWVFTAYMMASAITVPIYGKLSDVYGRKPFYLFGLGLFILGSVVSGQAHGISTLIAARAFQGIGAGAMMSMPRATVGDIFNPRERGRWMGVMAAVFGLTSIIGPSLGGWITDSWGWRWIFYINLPFAGLAFLFVLYALPNVRTDRLVRVDWAGSALLVMALVPLLLAFTWAGDRYAWGSPVLLGMFAFSAAMLIVFFLSERRAAEPVLSPDLFRSQIFSSAALVAFLISMGLFGSIMFIPLFLQGVLGLTATNSGEFMTPMMLSFIVGSVVGGQLVTRTGHYKAQAVLGTALATVGMVLLTPMTADTTRLEVTRDMMVIGIGMGLVMPVLNVAVQNAFPYRLMGVVNSSQQFVSSLGGVIAAPVLGTVLKNTFVAELPRHLPPELSAALAMAPADFREKVLANPQALVGPAAEALRQKFAAYGPAGEALYGQFVRAVRVSLALGITRLFGIALVFVGSAFVGAWFLRQIRLKQDEFYAEESPAVAPAAAAGGPSKAGSPSGAGGGAGAGRGGTGG